MCDLSSFGSVHIVQTATFNSDAALLAALHTLCHQRKRDFRQQPPPIVNQSLKLNCEEEEKYNTKPTQSGFQMLNICLRDILENNIR